MPTYDDAASLYLEQGNWWIHYAFPSDSREKASLVEATRLALNEDAINKVLDAITAHAQPSF